MTIDLGSNEIEAQVLAGRFVGKRLDQIADQDLVMLAQDLAKIRPVSVFASSE